MAKTVIITGSSSGIGLATARYFAEQGWQVAATSRSGKRSAELADFSTVRTFKLDVTDPSSIQPTVKAISNAYSSIDVLVNNAGYGTVGAFEASTSQQVQDQFDVNVFGLMNVTRALLPLFREQGAGVIVNVSSMGGRITFPLYSVYHSTKWAVEGFSESLAYELRPFNISIKLIEPGVIKSDFIGRSEVRFNNDNLDAYSEYEDTLIQGFHDSYKSGVDPVVVAKKIYQASTDGSNKLRYPVGKPAPLLTRLKIILPERLYFALMRRQLK